MCDIICTVANDRVEARVSVALMVGDKMSGRERLYLARQRESSLWGLFAGGLIAAESLQVAVEREFKEEVGGGLKLDQLRVAWNDFLVIMVLTPARTKVGFVFPAKIKDDVPSDSWKVEEGEVDLVKAFTVEEIVEMVSDKKLGVFKPEFNSVAMAEWVIDCLDMRTIRSTAGAGGWDDNDKRGFRQSHNLNYTQTHRRVFTVDAS